MPTGRFVTTLALAAALAAPPSRGAAGRALVVPAGRALVLVRSGDFETAIVALEAQGARLTHRMPPLAAGFVPPGLEHRFAPSAGATIEIERPVGDPAAGPRLANLPAGAGALRLFVGGRRELPSLPEPRPLGGDLVEPLPDEVSSIPKALTASECDRPSATSAFMVGKVAIGICMPESTGTENTEDWSLPDPRPAHSGDDRRDLVVAEIMEGCDTLVTNFPLAGLSFYYDVRRDVPVDVEPILHSVPDRDSWISSALESMGYGARAETRGVRGWLDELRERNDTDWAAAAFVADDLNDTDNGFAPTGFPFAYALLGGPYMVMTYDNDGWSIDRMDVVFRHELGHVFHALDEYRSAGNSCGSVAGYLPTPNANNDSAPGDPDCLSNVTCVMRGNTTPDACPFTLGQIGIRDLDSDGIPDVRDAPPSSRFDGPATVLLDTDGAVLTGVVSGRATDGESPHAPVTYFVNRVGLADWSLDGGAWLAQPPDDGAFGGRCEGVTIALSGLAEGWHSVLLRGTNDQDIVEPSPAEVRLYVNADCVDDGSEPDDDASRAVGRPAGSHVGHHCAYDSDWSRFHLANGAALTLTLAYDEALSDLSLRLVDESMADVSSASGVAGVATIPGVAPHAGTYYAVVEGAGEGESDYTLQLDADCVDDAFEPNGTALEGSLARLGTTPALTLCPGDLDHHLVSVRAGENLGATIVFDPALGNLDLELLDPAGASVATSAGAGGTETVGATPTIEGVYAIRVLGRTPTDTDVYDLDVVATGCLDDVNENDDTAATARPVPESVRAKICGGDVDWYLFDVVEPRLVRAQLEQDPAAADLELDLFDDAGRALLGRAIPDGGVDDLTRERLNPGSYRLRVWAPSGGAADYRLTFQVEDPLLLYVHEDAHDALLSWNEAGQECYLYRRSEDPSDFSAAVTHVVNEDDPSVPDVDRAIEDISYRDRDVIFDGRFLYCYLISPSDCGMSLRGSIKTANPYPVLIPSPGTVPSLEFTITIVNDGAADVFGATLRDDIADNVGSFTVTEIPAGATDASLPPPAGAALNGQVVVNGISVPAGSSRIVRFTVTPNRGLIIEKPVISNQAQVIYGSSPVAPGSVSQTDDPATLDFPDDTRVLVANFAQSFHAHAFWHRDVDVDLRVVDSCGNVIGEHDMTSTTCGTATLSVFRSHSCAVPDDRYEQIYTWNILPPGIYRIEVQYRSSGADDPDCGGRGTEDVTVAIQKEDFTTEYRTLTLTPGAPVLAFEYVR